MIYPISFSIPACKIVTTVPIKTQLFGTVIPGDNRTYVFNDEVSYYKDYQRSIFGKTKLKGGWDCLRHYEILANGCIPWFDNLQSCPPNTMTHFPKQLVLDAMSKGEKITEDDIQYYSNSLLEYTRNNLTTEKMAKYVLETAGNSNAKSCLFFSGEIYPDYLRCLTLLGFKQLLGKECHDYPGIPHIYTDYAMPNKLYGKGITYTCLLDKSIYRDSNYDKTIEQDIKNKKYDIIIYGSIHRGMPLWDLVNSVYSKKEIILLCGEDLHTCSFKNTHNNYNLFIREL